MLTKSDWKCALDVQNACNLSGIVHAWSRVMPKIWQEAEQTGEGTDFVNEHPINVLYASKVASLTKCDDVNDFIDAYDQCHEAMLSAPDEVRNPTLDPKLCSHAIKHEDGLGTVCLMCKTRLSGFITVDPDEVR